MKIYTTVRTSLYSGDYCCPYSMDKSIVNFTHELFQSECYKNWLSYGNSKISGQKSVGSWGPVATSFRLVLTYQRGALFVLFVYTLCGASALRSIELQSSLDDSSV